MLKGLFQKKDSSCCDIKIEELQEGSKEETMDHKDKDEQPLRFAIIEGPKF